MAVTIKEVARLAGASTAAVSATLNGTRGKNIRVSEPTRERIYAAAAELGYMSNPVARSLATGKSLALGLMLPYVEAFTDHNPFCAQVTNGIMGEMVRSRYNLMLYTAGLSADRSDPSSLIDSRVDGVILVMPPEDSPLFLKCETRHIPYISVLRERIEGTWSINADDFEGGRIATAHLAGLGHKRIAHLMGAEGITTTAPRLAGYKRALAEAALPIDSSFVCKAGFDWRGGYRVAKELLSFPSGRRPTAFFAANDLCAEGAMRAIREAGLSIPNDIAIVGYDDTWFATMTQPTLTSVRMPIEQMGALAVQMLVDRVEGRQVANPLPILPVTLTVRDSCGARMPELSS